MTEFTQTKLTIQNSHRSPAKVRQLTPEQIGIPSGEQDEGDDENRSKILRQKATEATNNGGLGAAICTDNGEIVSASQLSKGISQEIHALELAVWKGYDETGSPIIEAAVASDNMEKLPCGRCLQVLSDYSDEKEVSIWITRDANTEEHSLNNLLSR
jgi:cytidine deaminase